MTDDPSNIDSVQGFESENQITHEIIGAAINIHKSLGPGLLESVYHECMILELQERGLPFRTELAVPLTYLGRTLKAVHRIDLLVDDCVVVELKAVDSLNKVHEAQLLTYLRLTGKRVGLLINFNQSVIRNGVKRLVL